MGVEWLISRLYLSHNNNCPPKFCNTCIFNFPCVSVVPREIEDNAYAKFEKANKEKVYYGRCANGRYRLDLMKISRWDFGKCICTLYSIQCNRPSDQCKSKRLSTTSEFERFYKESCYWLISVAAVFVSSLKGRESWVTSGESREGAPGGPSPT